MRRFSIDETEGLNQTNSSPISTKYKHEYNKNVLKLIKISSKSINNLNVQIIMHNNETDDFCSMLLRCFDGLSRGVLGGGHVLVPWCEGRCGGGSGRSGSSVVVVLEVGSVAAPGVVVAAATDGPLRE